MFVQLHVELEGEVVVDRMLRGIEERAADVSGAWPAVVAVFRDVVGKAFATEGGSTGAPWKPLARSTQAERRRLGFPPAHPILRRTGALARSLTTPDGAIVSTTPTTLRIGSAVPYFRYHQSNEPRTRLPRRAPVNLTADDRTALMHPLRLWVTGRDPNAARRAPIR
jgi:phage gpG-like protein